MIDFSRYTIGDVVTVHCCDDCSRAADVVPKTPADSGVASWLCEVCGHFGIGSLTDCKIENWLRLRPLQPNATVTGTQPFPFKGDPDIESSTQLRAQQQPRAARLQRKHPVC